jgi:hypothetical protein
MARGLRALILGSAPDVVAARGWPRDGLDVIVAINNAWAVRPDWDVLIHPEDFPPERLPPRLGPGQALRGAADFVPAVNAHGGFVFAGGTMAFTAGYWALEALRPAVIAFLGCDMIYPAEGDGRRASHFYGRGRADPLRPDPTLQSLEAKSARLQVLAAEAGCAVVNLSRLPASRLGFPRALPGAVARWDADATRRLCAETLSPAAREAAARARAAEAALGYAAPDGRYWRSLGAYDPAALRAVDALWLAAVRRDAAAA